MRRGGRRGDLLELLDVHLARHPDREDLDAGSLGEVRLVLGLVGLVVRLAVSDEDGEVGDAWARSVSGREHVRSNSEGAIIMLTYSEI